MKTARRIAIAVVASVFVTGASMGVALPALAAASDMREVALALAGSTSGEDLVVALEAVGEAMPAEDLDELVLSLDPSYLVASNGALVARTGAIGWKMDAGPTLVVFRVDDGDIGLSSLTIVVDSSRQVVATNEILMSAGASGQLEVQQWSNRALVSRETVQASTARLGGAVTVASTLTTYGSGRSTTSSQSHRFTAATLGSNLLSSGSGGAAATSTSLRGASGAASNLAATTDKDIGHIGKVPAKTFWSKFNTCLSNAGIAAWVIALIAGICAFAGVGTAGVAFVACAVGVVGGASGTLGYCFASATS